MIKFTNVSLRHGPLLLFSELTLTIHPGQVAGLIGANGSGKSSLLSLLRTELQVDDGNVQLPKSWVMAHVAQETPALESSATDFVLDGDHEYRQLNRQLEAAESDQNGNEIAHIHVQLENIDGYTAPSRAKRLLAGLGFSNSESNQPVKSFSGGWRMRLNLAQALMCRSDLLLLDEPTNHLDLDAVIWLEHWLKQYRGTIIVISHDRDFLDSIVNVTLHIEHKQLKSYAGNYSQFERQRIEHLALQQSLRKKQQRNREHLESFVRRFRAKASKAKQAQSRLKALEKMGQIEAAHADSPFRFSFKPAKLTAHTLIDIEDANIGYGDHLVLSQVGYRMGSGDRIGLLGRNGNGKSTLVKAIAGSLELQSGSMITAKNLNIGYFAQHQLEILNLTASPMQHMKLLAPQASEQELRNFLGGFAFGNDRANEPIAPRSGGEKARLALALIIYQQPDLLLLDEPTNHLDIEMRQALTLALQSYDGGLILVSHDRHLLKASCDEFYLVDNAKVNPYNGSLEDYTAWLLEKSRNINDNSDNIPSDIPSKKEKRQKTAENRLKLKPLRNRLRDLDRQLATAETMIKQLDTQISDPSLYDSKSAESIQTLLKKQAHYRSNHQTMEDEWLRLSEEIEQITNPN